MRKRPPKWGSFLYGDIMREKIYHHQLKKIFEKFKRNWFYTYSYLNIMNIDNFEAKKILSTFVKKNFIYRESAEIKFNNHDRLYNINIQEKWRLTGKAIVELYYVFGVEIEDSDYSEAAILTLSE